LITSHYKYITYKLQIILFYNITITITVTITVTVTVTVTVTASYTSNQNYITLHYIILHYAKLKSIYSYLYLYSHIEVFFTTVSSSLTMS